MPTMLTRCSHQSVLLALVAGLSLAAGCGTAGSAPTAGVDVTGAWARTTPARATTGVVYLTITGHQTDRLDTVTVDPSVAATASLHQMVAVDGSVVAGSDRGAGGGGHHDNSGGAAAGGDDAAAADGGGAGQEQATAMKPVTGGLAIPSGRDIVLGPGGYHVMLQELARPLAAGDSFPLVLHFQRAGGETVEVEVRDDAP